MVTGSHDKPSVTRAKLIHIHTDKIHIDADRQQGPLRGRESCYSIAPTKLLLVINIYQI